MSLDRWQAHLHAHFSSLRATRNGNAVFALEHDLTNEQFEELVQGVHKQVIMGSPSDRHWLVWAVYSAEIGYEYSGEEYWQTFAERTPGWLGYGDRNYIRAVFKTFHRELGGPYPRGRWAEAFRIICWPITHSILPKDLQRELAEILYDLRDHYTFDLLQSPKALGEKIDAFSWRSNSRFQHFADEHELVGQIAAALLRDTKKSESQLILPSTLKRIAADLERERRAREWLTSAQTSAARLTLRGLSRGYESDSDEPEIGSGAKSERRKTVVDLGIEPELVLVRTTGNLWEVHLRLPDLSRLLGRFPEFKLILTGERCTVKGAKGAPLPRGFLLYGSQEVVLASWPGSNEVLLKFENSIEELDFLLTTECLLRPGPRWLFKILGDGTAIEVKGRIIRPGTEYVVLSTKGSPEEFPTIHSRPLDVQCEGLSAVMLDVPDTVSEIYKDQVRDLGFHSAGTLRVQPVGLAAASWDEEGYAEWLTSDSPLLKIGADHELRGMVLNLVGPAGSRIEISEQTVQSPLYVELEELLPGRYKLHVITQIPGQSSAEVVGTLNFGIRHPRGSQSVATTGNPFRVLLSPAAPSLEQLWSGEARIEILGPKGRKAQSKLEFFLDETRAQRRLEKLMPPVNLPCNADNWQDSLESIQRDTKIQNACSEAVRCRLHIECEELGYFSVDCEREFSPIRWILRYENNGYWLRLAQYESANITFAYFSYEYPTRLIPLLVAGESAFKVSPEGGLYLAKTEDFLCSVFVLGQMTSLSDLDHKVDAAVSLNTAADITNFLMVLSAWVGANIPGDPISKMRKERVVRLLRERLLSHLCGTDWVKIEQKLQEAPSVLWDLRFAVATKAHQAGVGTELFHRQPELASMNAQDLSAFLVSFVHRQLDLPLFLRDGTSQQDSQLWMMELAYRLMSRPEGATRWANSGFSAGLAYLRMNSVVLRIARYVFLLRDARVLPKVRRLEELGR